MKKIKKNKFSLLAQAYYESISAFHQQLYDQNAYPLQAINAAYQPLPVKKTKDTFFDRILLNCSLRNTQADCYYQFSQVQLVAVSPHECRLHLELTQLYPLAANVIMRPKQFSHSQCNIVFKQNIQDYYIDFTFPNGQVIQCILTLNTHRLKKQLNHLTQIQAAQQPDLHWIISPDCYQAAHQPFYPVRDIELTAYGEQSATQYSTRYGLDPKQEIELMLNQRLKSMPMSVPLPAIYATSYIEFSNWLNSASSIIAYPQQHNYFTLLINRLTTTTQYHYSAWPLLQADSISPYGIQSFQLKQNFPLHVWGHGYLECLIRVPHPHSKERYDVVLQNHGDVLEFNRLEREYLATSVPLTQDKPRKISAQDLGHQPLYDAEVYEKWLSGYWLTLKFPLSQMIELHPHTSYRFRLYRSTLQGEKATPQWVRPEDLIILTGYFAFQYNINHLFSDDEYAYLVQS